MEKVQNLGTKSAFTPLFYDVYVLLIAFIVASIYKFYLKIKLIIVSKFSFFKLHPN